MVSFLQYLQYCLGIILWMWVLQLSLSASELPNHQKKAIYLPQRIGRTSRQSLRLGSDSTHLITRERQGNIERFEIPSDSEFQPSVPVDRVETIEVIADRQEYNRQTKVITATGRVTMRFAQSVLTSDRLEIDLNDRLAVARDNVTLRRGEQVLQGSRFEYYLVADRGVVYNAGGEIYQSSLGRDTDFKQQLAPEQTILDRALSDRLANNQPLTEVTAAEGIGATIGSQGINLIDGDSSTGGAVNRLRFEAERLDFETTTWTAQNLRLTNDPFSPPELELRAETATFQQLDTFRSELTTQKSRLVVDDRLTVPLLTSGFVFDRRPRRPGLFNVAFDGKERGGLYLERTWSIVDNANFSWEIAPQYFLQRALFPDSFDFSGSDEGGVFNSAVFGLESGINASFTPRTSLEASSSLNSLEWDELEDNLRAGVGLQQIVGKLDNPYRLALEYNYRDRLFNGSLGFRTVRESIGGVVTSPQIAVGDTGITFRYQGSIQNISADTDRPDLLAADRENDRINLTRYQAAAFVNQSFSLWQGKALPSTPDLGLRYTPTPVVPYLDLFAGISGVGSFYSNSDSQLSLEGTIGIRGQLGHFSRSWLDYTGFTLSYSQNIRGDESPFLFDRLVDRQTLSVGITQQLYGPIRLGWQTSFDLNDNDEISTDYTLEYSRRTHNITLRYNPVLEIGSFSLRISDFNWQGDPQPFEEQGITPVIQGVN